ncbi:hypothetical protein M3Y97_00510100 [Aphelenchoides bicaudatus]|nr:hypothetical protein M3Y97_00510100 [Aphelenchoides bicaudatus]
MRRVFILFFAIWALQVNSKPVQDVDSVGPRYKQLTDNFDEKLKYVDHIEDGKFVDTTPETMPTIQFLMSTAEPDSKMDEELDAESSSVEEEEHPIVLATNATALSNSKELNPTEHQLYVEEHQNSEVFNEKQELSAKKVIPQIIMSVGGVPTIVPQTESAPQTTQVEPITTSMNETPSKSKSKVEEYVSNSKQKLSSFNDKQKPVEQKPSEQKSSDVSEKPTTSPKLDAKQDEHEENVVDERGEESMDENGQPFDPKQRQNHQQGSLIYAQPVPGIHGNPQPLPTFQPSLTTTKSPIEQKTTTEPKTPSESSDKGWWDKIKDGFACAQGACSGVFKSNTTAKPRELKPPTIIRRARHNEQNNKVEVVCRCANAE